MNNTTMTCSDAAERMPDAYYGELSQEDQEAFHAHMESCRKCAGDFARMRETLAAMKRFSPAAPGEEFWHSWDKALRTKLQRAQSAPEPHTTRIFPFRAAHIPGWAYGAAAILLVAVGIYLGRVLYPAPPAALNPSQAVSVEMAAPANSEDSTSRLAMQYIERSRNVLLGIINSDDSTPSPDNLGQQQRVSRDLVRQAAYLKTALNQPDQQRLRQLIQDLEVILLQLANVEVRPGVPIVEMVKQGVDKRSILLKINCEELKAQSKKSPPAANDRKSHL
jgi:hypothetical protein